MRTIRPLRILVWISMLTTIAACTLPGYGEQRRFGGHNNCRNGGRTSDWRRGHSNGSLSLQAPPPRQRRRQVRRAQPRPRWNQSSRWWQAWPYAGLALVRPTPS